MATRRRSTPAFRPSPAAGPTNRPSTRQATALLAGLVLVAAALGVASWVVKPATARSFSLFYGSVFLNDDANPVAIDLASGKPTVRLANAFTAVSAKVRSDLDVVPLQDSSTFMLNAATGEFNIVDTSGLVIKQSGGGVPLRYPGPARAVAAGPNAFIVQPRTSTARVYLVGPNTVASAINEGSRVRARGYATLRAPIAAVPGALASADGSLWVLTAPTSSSALQVVQLSVPAASNNNAELTRRPSGSVTGPAALESSTRMPDGTGGDLVAVASAGGLTVHDGDTTTSVPVPVPDAVDRILPVTNLQGEFAFLFHTGRGWSEVSTPVHRAAAAAATVQRLTSIGPDAALVTPAASNGQVFTMDSAGAGDLWRIAGGAASLLDGAEQYPAVTGEASGLSGADVLADGNRVIYNVRGRYRAEVVFTDGSHAPQSIDKHSGVKIDPTGATALADGVATHPARKRIISPTDPIPTTPGKSPAPTTPTPTPSPTSGSKPDPIVPIVPDPINCRTTRQRPHIPVVTVVERGSRSARLSWTYPLLDPSDCAASSYVVAVAAVTSGRPQPPSQIPVQGQTGVTLSGLFPDTEYQVTVTAYINSIGTSSAAVSLTTSVEGPAAPTGVTTTVDSSGNWVVSWTSCGGVSSGCVPASSWQIIPSFCDGVGLSSPPDKQDLIGDPSLHEFHVTYQGSDALLGRGLSFQIEGVGEQGTIGTPAADGTCTHSWTAPVAADITLHASAPPVTTTSQATTAITVSADFARGRIHDLGGLGATLVYTLSSNGQVVDTATAGTASDAGARLTGVTAGRIYTVSATATPPGHTEAATQVGPVGVQPTSAEWPTPTVTASFDKTAVSTGTLTLGIDLGAAMTRGESFDLVDSTLTCGGNTVLPLDHADITPGQPITFSGIDRFTYRGDCVVSIQLAQHPATATDPPLFGAGLSPVAHSDSLSIPAPSLGTTADDFTAQFVDGAAPGQPRIAVSYHGNDDLTFATGWQFTVDNGAGNGGQPDCGSSSQPPTTTIAVDPGCVRGAGPWTVSVSYRYFVVQANFANIAVTGTAPAPVELTTLSFDPGTWTGTADAAQVVVHYTGSADESALATLDWTETVTSNGTPCGSSTDTPATDAAGGPSIAIDLSACPATAVPSGSGPTGSGPTGSGPGGSGPPSDPPTSADPPQANVYTLTIHVHDPNYGGSKDFTLEVAGAPPQ